MLDLQEGDQDPGYMMEVEVEEQDRVFCLVSSNFTEIKTCVFIWKYNKHYFFSTQ